LFWLNPSRVFTSGLTSQHRSGSKTKGLNTMYPAARSAHHANVNPVLLTFRITGKAGIPQPFWEREVYWFDKKNVEPNAFDSEYLERLRARDPRTQEHFAGYFNRLLAIKLRCNGIYGASMDDLRQDTLIRALKSIYEGKVDCPQSLAAFVYGVCNNVIKEFVRGEINSRTRDTNEFPDLPDPRYSAEDHLRHQEARKSVTLVLNGLPEKDRAILNSVFIAEMDKDAICREHGITRDYLRVLLHRSLHNARKLLDKHHNG
jgi:RNA polymerase sigma-70 factor (ECF subfamily)